MPDIYLYTVPSDASASDVRLRDPTTIAGAGTITGTLSVTLDALTLSSAGQVILDGDLAATLGTLTLGSVGQLIIDGDLSVTLGTLTLSASGYGILDADLAVTLDAITLSGVGQTSIAANASITLDALTLAAIGKVEIDADEGTTLGALTLAATGALGLTSSSGITLDDLTLESGAILEAAPDRGDIGPTRAQRRAKSQKRNQIYLERERDKQAALVASATANVALANMSLSATGALGPDPAIQAANDDYARLRAMDEEDIEMLLLAA